LGLLALAGVQSCTDVSITAIPVARIEVVPAEVNLTYGGTMRLDAEVTDGEGRQLPDRFVVWESTDPEVATVSPRGLVTAVGAGSATIRTSSEGVTGSATVTVGDAPVIQLGDQAVTLVGVAGSPGAQAAVVKVSNSGGGILDGLSTSIVYGSARSGWLATTVNPTKAPAELVISATAEGLAAGAYTADVQVSSPAASNGPQTVHVQLNVVEGNPSIRVSPGVIGLAATEEEHPSALQLLVTNEGGRQITGLATQVRYVVGPPGWLTATLASGVTPTSLSLGIQGFPAGLYEARVDVSSPDAVNSPFTVVVTLRLAGSAPVAPSNLVAVAASKSQIDLTWTDNSSNETGFEIERSTIPGVNWTLVTTTAPNQRAFSNTGLSPLTTYAYRVRAVNATGKSAPSATASARTPEASAPTTATTQAASGVTATAATLNGSVNPNGAATAVQFQWSRKSNLSGSTLTAVQNIGSGTTPVKVDVRLTRLLPGTTYYFRVVASNLNGTVSGTILEFKTKKRNDDDDDDDDDDGS
jgi:hypothetical protein